MALAPIAILPDDLKETLKHSPLLPIYTKLFTSLGRAVGEGIYRIEGGPLRGKYLFVNPAAVRAYLLGNYEPEVTRAVLDYCKPGMTVFDVGAHYGYFSLLMAQAIGPDGWCVAFEPMSANYSHIRQSIQKNGMSNLRVEQIALGNVVGALPFRLNENALMGRLEHLVPTDDLADFNEFEDVEVQSLDSYVLKKDIKELGFIKVDIEGAETEFLEGAVATIRDCRPVLLVEVHTFMPPEKHARPFVMTLINYGYQVLDIATRRPISPDDFTGGHVLAIPLDSSVHG